MIKARSAEDLVAEAREHVVCLKRDCHKAHRRLANEKTGNPAAVAALEQRSRAAAALPVEITLTPRIARMQVPWRERQLSKHKLTVSNATRLREAIDRLTVVVQCASAHAALTPKDHDCVAELTRWLSEITLVKQGLFDETTWHIATHDDQASAGAAP